MLMHNTAELRFESHIQPSLCLNVWSGYTACSLFYCIVSLAYTCVKNTYVLSGSYLCALGCLGWLTKGMLQCIASIIALCYQCYTCIIACFPSVCSPIAVYALEVREIATKDNQCGLLSGMLR